MAKSSGNRRAVSGLSPRYTNYIYRRRLLTATYVCWALSAMPRGKLSITTTITSPSNSVEPSQSSPTWQSPRSLRPPLNHPTACMYTANHWNLLTKIFTMRAMWGRGGLMELLQLMVLWFYFFERARELWLRMDFRRYKNDFSFALSVANVVIMFLAATILNSIEQNGVFCSWNVEWELKKEEIYTTHNARRTNDDVGF